MGVFLLLLKEAIFTQKSIFYDFIYLRIMGDLFILINFSKILNHLIFHDK